MTRYYVDNPLPFYELYKIFDAYEITAEKDHYNNHYPIFWSYDFWNLRTNSKAKENTNKFCDMLNRMEGEL